MAKGTRRMRSKIGNGEVKETPNRLKEKSRKEI